MVRLYFLVSLVSWPALLCAQILNIEKAAIDGDSTGHLAGNVSVGLIIYNRSASINEPAEYSGLDLKSSLAFFLGEHRLSSITHFDYLRVNKKAIANTGYQHIRFDYFRRKRIHPELFVQYQYDRFRGLSDRVIGGTGIRFQLVKNKTFSFVFSTGLMREYETWRNQVTEQLLQVNFWKSTSYFVVRKQISNWAEINAIQYFQSGYDSDMRFFRNRLSTDMNLNTRLTDRLQWTTTFSLSYESKPLVPIINTIYRISNSLTIKF